MPAYVAFLRAVNVGGRFVKMAALRDALDDAGYADVQTHIQSGNVRVTSPMRSVAKVSADLERVLSQAAGFSIPAIVRSPAHLRALVEAAADVPPALEGARRYVGFAAGPIPAAGQKALAAWDAPGERVTVLGDTVIADLTVAFHTIKLTNARMEKLTGLPSTWRDMKVVHAIDEKWGPT